MKLFPEEQELPISDILLQLIYLSTATHGVVKGSNKTELLYRTIYGFKVKIY